MLNIIRQYKWLPALAVVAVAVACLAVFPVHSWADALSEACSGAGLQSSGGKCSGGGDLSGVVQGAINVVSGIVGIVAVIMIIVGGFKYITSAGEANAVSSAKRTIIYAMVGLVIVALAQIIVHFVVKQSADSVAAVPAILYKHFAV